MASLNEMSELEYLKYGKFKQFLHKLVLFFVNIPVHLKNFLLGIVGAIKGVGMAIANEFIDIIQTFKNGDYKTRVSYVIMGFGSFMRGQWLRGLLFFAFEVIFIAYTSVYGVYWMGRLTLKGLQETGEVDVITEVLGIEMKTTTYVYGDNTLQIMIYGTLSILFILCFIYTWRLNIKQNKIAQQLQFQKRKLRTAREDLKAMLDQQFHTTVLALPVLGIVMFTVMPIILMIMVAFTNYDFDHSPPTNLFAWVGLDNFNDLFVWSNGSSAFSATFGELLCWTLIWAFFATFTNYFLGMLVAMAINKKGIKFKKLWRTILIITIAVPQFISLLYVSKLFDTSGLINRALINSGIIDSALPFWTNATWARVMVILVNIWVGVPYLMLITTGVLMNIPADLYESARIDGANAFQQYCKITLPYMLFVTGPYLLTSFTANINNFNVIYLLTGGAPYTLSNSAGKTDLLITWLYRLTVTNNDYKLASVIGIMVFLVVACISLVVYNLMPSIKNEEDFQ